MALTRRALAAALAGCALAATTVSPALAYWKASGRGTGTVPTANAAPNALTIVLSVVSGHAIKAAGQAGSASPYAATVTVTLCKGSNFPCPVGSSTTFNPTVTGGSYTVTTANLNNTGTYWGKVGQVQNSGWDDIKFAAGTVTP